MADTRFKKGQSGNPNGRPALPQDIRDIRTFNKFELERILNRLVFMPHPEIKALTKSKTAPIFEMVVAKILDNAARYGDHWKAEFILNRLVGKPQDIPVDLPDLPAIGAAVKRSFSEFCVQAAYPPPFARQIDMFNFGIAIDDPRLLLGSRGYGKTDYVTVLGVAYDIYSAWFDGTETSNLIISKSKTRNSAMLSEIAGALEKNGVKLDKQNSSHIRVEGHTGKDHSVEALPMRASFRGRHPVRVIMDDPVTEEDTSEATRVLVKKKYDEAYKLSKNIVIIGQPAHAFDLYAELRPTLKKLEVPHGQIKELDADLVAMKLFGVDAHSIEMSYHLRIPESGTMIFSNLKYIDKMPDGETIAFIDPSDGGDFTAITCARGLMDGIAAQGHAWKRAWYHCLDEIVPILKARKVKKLYFETNCTGKQPLIQLREICGPLGIGVEGVHSDTNKHAVIQAAGSYSHMIHLSKESDRVYTDQVVKYEYNSKHDDAPDSLARLLERIGLIRGRK